MNYNVHDLAPSKNLLSTLFEMEVDKIAGNIRRESQDEKDKLIIKLQENLKRLDDENTRLRQRINNLKASVESI